MGGGQPYMYDAVPKETSERPQSSFDPKSVSRASLAPKAPRPKQEGPLISFNQHPDSYLILPYGNINAKAMGPSVKKHIKRTRIIQWVLRLFELIGSCGILVLLILLSGFEASTGWIMRIPPGFAILHCLYSIYHLSRSARGRTPGSSASYMLFSSAFDATLIPFFAFNAIMLSSQYKVAQTGPGAVGEWTTLLADGQKIVPTMVGSAFLCSTITGCLLVFSLGFSLYLAVTFRKITQLPPDMNPLEDHLTSRHKRNKSSMSVSTMSEKRISFPLESQRNSGAPYQELSRPPTIPFMHTRTGSNETFSTYRSTPPGSRDSRLDLPSRQYQISAKNSPNSSVSDLNRRSQPPSHIKRSTYTGLPRNEPNNTSPIRDAWFKSENLDLVKSTKAYPNVSSTRSSPRNQAYSPLHHRRDSSNDLSSMKSFPSSHPNPLDQNPPSSRVPQYSNARNQFKQAEQNSYTKSNNGNNNISVSTSQSKTRALTETSSNPGRRENSSLYSGDLADQHHNEDESSRHMPSNGDVFRAKGYGDLRAATPPMMVGGRQVSSGNDFSARNAGYRRDVSGKIAEEGRGTAAAGQGWETRFRKVSGL